MKTIYQGNFYWENRRIELELFFARNKQCLLHHSNSNTMDDSPHVIVVEVVVFAIASHETEPEITNQ